jgi:hypothetical protein
MIRIFDGKAAALIVVELQMRSNQAPQMLFNPNGELDPAQLVEIERARELSGSPDDYGKVSLVAGVHPALNLLFNAFDITDAQKSSATA